MHSLKILFIFVMILTSACNLSTAANQSELTAIPTITVVDQPTRTPFPAAEDSNAGSSANDTSESNTGNIPSATNLPPEEAVTICNKQTDWHTYTVSEGDTLFDIARRANSTVDTLVSANCLVDAGLISVGQVLYVPSPVEPKPGNDDTVQTNDPNRYTTELWWVIQGDNGATGFAVGCGDSIYLQQSGIPANLNIDETLKRAFSYLTDDSNIGAGQADRGWWNPMSKTSLVVSNYSIDGLDGSHVTANLSGQLTLIGVCFDVQLEAQIALNLMHLTGTRSATIYVNGQNMAHLFDMSGLRQKDSYTWEEFQNTAPIDTSKIIRFWVGSETNGVADAISAGCSYLAPIITNSVKSDNVINDLHIAFEALFDPDRENPSTVFTNYLKDQNLQAFDISVENGHATVHIGPKMLAGGVCTDPVIEGQIIQTIFQFDEIQTATVYINGDTNLRQIVDQSGRPEVADHIYTRS